MRRNDRNLTNFQDIIQQLHVCDVIHIGLNDRTYPYVVPVSFGLNVENRKAVVYFHSEKEGKKINLIKKDPRAFVQAEILYSYYDIPHTAVSCSYSSIMAHGIIEEIPRKDYPFAMELILTHCGYEGFQFDERLYDQITIFKIVLEGLTGQQNYHRHNTQY